MNYNAVSGPVLFAVLLAVCALLLLIVVVQQFLAKRHVRVMITQLRQRLTEEIEDQLYQQAALQREETLKSLHQLNESLITTFGSMSRSQNEQVNAAIRQS